MKFDWSDKPKMYIGDSVYVEMKDRRIKMTTENGAPINIIYLEPEVFLTLINFVKADDKPVDLVGDDDSW